MIQAAAALSSKHKLLADEAGAAATLYQSPAWMAAVAHAFPQWAPRYLTDQAGDLVLPFMERRIGPARQLVSMPFGTYGGPLSREDAPALVTEAFHELAGSVSRPLTLRFEMTLFRPSAPVAEAASRVFGDSLTTYNTFLVPLDRGFEWIWNTGYDKDVRWCVRKARRNHVEVTAETSPEGARTLQELHGAQMAGWGKRPYTVDELWGVARSLGEDAKIWISRLKGKPVCATLILYHQGRDVYPWVSGSTPEAREVRAYHCMMNDAMEDGCTRGYEVWNWGGSVGRVEVEKFKRDMAGQEQSVSRVYYESPWVARARTLMRRG